MNRLFATVAVFFLFGAANIRADEKIYRQATGDYKLSYPRDHGAHPEFETEWWYVTGHLTADTGETFGFELVFFRVGVDQDPHSSSAWKMDSFHFAHFALTNDREQKYVHFARSSRGSFEQAGESTGRLNVWLRDWKLELNGDKLTLAAAEDGNEVRLELTPKKPLIFHGVNGLSKKGPAPGDNSYYTSFTRLEGTGSLKTNGIQYSLTHASAWLDQEFTSSKLARGTEGWDWFALQLDNGEELMAYNLRNSNGEPSEFSSGSWVRADGSVVPLKREDFKIQTLAKWTSPSTGITYPSQWRLEVPQAKLSVEITPTVKDQELMSKNPGGTTYWEGRSLVTGALNSQPVTGAAYVELVGYRAAP